jgi:PAS domain S-box-containing protein
MTGSYNPILVAISVLIAVLAAFVALAMAARVTAAQGRFRAAWLAGGSLALGVGIWSMHFVGMLAFRLGVPVAYDVPLVLLSAGVPILASLLALWVMSRPVATVPGMAIAAVLMGIAIAGMHFIGMAAMRLPAHISWRGGWGVASVTIAVAASAAALWLGYHYRRDETAHALRAKGAAAVALGAGIAGMHYAGMATARFTPHGTTLRVTRQDLLQTPGLAMAVAIATFSVLAVALVGALADRRMRQRSAETEALRRSQDRFRSLVTATAQVIWTADAAGQFREEQREWSAFTGTSAEDYHGSGWLRSVHPDDRARVESVWRRAVETRSAYETELRLRRWDGEYRIMTMRGVPVLEPDGRIREWVGSNTDITERRREEAARDFLAEATRVLASSLDYETTLSTVARLAVPRLADWCAVDLSGEGGRLRRVAVAGPNPALEELARRMEERYPADPASPYGTHAVIRSGEPRMMPEVTEVMLQEFAHDEEHLRMMRALELRSYVLVPLRARGRTLGALTLVSSDPARRYGPADLGLAEELAGRAAVAIDNAQLFHETEESRAQLEQQAAELEETQAEMEMAHDELQSANEELVARTADAERARAAADEANQAKSAFLATMSHELRTPLNAIGGYAQLIEMEIHGPITTAQRENLEKIRRNQTHLLGLINDVLNFAKVEAGQVQYHLAAVPVNATLAALEALVEPQIRSKGLRYTFRDGDPGVRVRADRERMEQILINLLSNAIKFTERGGSVVMEWEADAEEVRIRVCDTGRGIPADKIGTIFEPFVQVDPALTRSTEGTGLGLAISRDLARAMGGDLSTRSREGEGTTFTLVLPRAADAGGDSPPEGDEPGGLEGEETAAA